MKHIFNIVFILMAVIMSSCASTGQRKQNADVQTEYGDTHYTKLIMLTVNGESHEFVCYTCSKWENGIAHWPGCKYCKHDNSGY